MFRFKLSRLLCPTVVALITGCATAPIAAPALPATDMSAVGIQVQVRPPLGLGGPYDVQAVDFVQLDDRGAWVGEVLYASKFNKGGRVYLLNVPPARYVAVAAMVKLGLPGSESIYLPYFSQGLIDATQVVAISGQLAYAGRHLADSAAGVCAPNADPAQLHLAESIAPGVPKCGLLRILLHELATHPVVIVNGSAFTMGPSTYHYRGTQRESARDADAERAFRRQAAEDLAPAGWVLPED